MAEGVGASVLVDMVIGVGEMGRKGSIVGGGIVSGSRAFFQGVDDPLKEGVGPNLLLIKTLSRG